MSDRDRWTMQARGFGEALTARDGSNFLTGNGYLGVRGTLDPWRAEQYPAITVSDTYDMADGRWRELCTVPHGSYASLRDEAGVDLLARRDEGVLHRTLDLRDGTLTHAYEPEGAEAPHVTMQRFASLTDLHLVAGRLTLHAPKGGRFTLDVGIDAHVWSLHGDHFAVREPVVQDGAGDLGHGARLGFSCRTVERGTRIEVREGVAVDATDGVTVLASTRPFDVDDGRLVRRVTLELPAGGTVHVTRAYAVATSNDVDTATDVAGDPAAAADATVDRALALGWDALHGAQRAAWDAFWAVSDVQIDGDDVAQRALRFGIYHNRIATPVHSDRLPIGARGLSCQAYQGAAFWDQETYNLDVFLHTDPAVARNLLTYRWRTLHGAREKAKRLGYEGAYYAWISGDDGEELCPDWFFREVITGREIRNHFNDQQIHVSPDIAVTIEEYVEATGDEAFLVRYGAEILFEVARFIASRVVWVPHRKRYELHRVLGPDEYHEFVDDDAFTNHQARRAVRAALAVRTRLAEIAPRELSALNARLAIGEEELGTWRDVAERLFVPEADPHTGVIEQFRDYFTLEDVTPDVLKERLIDPGEYWGWPIGVAVHTQVLKQADVLQRLVQEVDTPLEVLDANYAYYEPRTQHGSSLSPSVHAIAAARLGRVDDAQRYFMKSALVDLEGDFKAVSGGTFIGGIHTAACAGTWQAAVHGFGGLQVRKDRLRIDPILPRGWTRLRYAAMRHGQRVWVTVLPDRVTVMAEDANEHVVPVEMGGTWFELAPGDGCELAGATRSPHEGGRE